MENGVWVVDSSDQGSLHVDLERNLTQYQPHGVGGGGRGVQLYSVLPTNRLMGMFSWMGLHFHNWGLFLKRPGNFLGQKANFEIKVCWIVLQFLAYKPVNFALLGDSFIVSLFFKIFETLILNGNMANIHVKQLFGPETSLRPFKKQVPGLSIMGLHFQYGNY